MKYVMLNREDIFKIIALFESEQTLELVRVGSLTCYANLTEEQLNILDKNHFAAGIPYFWENEITLVESA